MVESRVDRVRLERLCYKGAACASICFDFRTATATRKAMLRRGHERTPVNTVTRTRMWPGNARRGTLETRRSRWRWDNVETGVDNPSRVASFRRVRDFSFPTSSPARPTRSPESTGFADSTCCVATRSRNFRMPSVVPSIGAVNSCLRNYYSSSPELVSFYVRCTFPCT